MGTCWVARLRQEDGFDIAGNGFLHIDNGGGPSGGPAGRSGSGIGGLKNQASWVRRLTLGGGALSFRVGCGSRVERD